jgi:hypothetical protein
MVITTIIKKLEKIYKDKGDLQLKVYDSFFDVVEEIEEITIDRDMVTLDINLDKLGLEKQDAT